MAAAGIPSRGRTRRSRSTATGTSRNACGMSRTTRFAPGSAPPRRNGPGVVARRTTHTTTPKDCRLH